MIVLDTDTLTFFFQNHPRVLERFGKVSEDVAITIITRVETLRGRFDSLLKAADGDELRRGQERLIESERNLARIPLILAVDEAAATEFDRLRQNRKLKKIGRADLLIAAITLANRATLVSRNLKHFRQVPGLALENWAD
jgi:tRNA(fMet)-specific endonuclease VapC